MTPPSLPENFDELEETEQTDTQDVDHRRLVHYHYVRNTEECNNPHYDALTDPMCVLRSRLFHHASNPWEGETLELKDAIIRATERRETLPGKDTPCPIVFDAEDVRETKKLNEEQRKRTMLLRCGRTCSASDRRAVYPPSTTRRPWYSAST